VHTLLFFVHKKTFQREKFLLFKKKMSFKTPKNPFLVVFFGWFFWVGILLATLPDSRGG
jgi:hypothetical protein